MYVYLFVYGPYAYHNIATEKFCGANEKEREKMNVVENKQIMKSNAKTECLK